MEGVEQRDGGNQKEVDWTMEPPVLAKQSTSVNEEPWRAGLLSRPLMPRKFSSEQEREYMLAKLPPKITFTYKKICELYTQLQQEINTIQPTIGSVVEKEGTYFLAACQHRLQELEADFDKDRTITRHYDAAKAGKRSPLKSKGTVKLGEQEVLELSNLCGSQRKEIQQLKAQLDKLERQKALLNAQLKRALQTVQSLTNTLRRLEQKLDDPNDSAAPLQSELADIKDPLHHSSASPGLQRAAHVPFKHQPREELLRALGKKDQSDNPSPIQNEGQGQSQEMVAKYVRTIERLKLQLANEKRLTKRLKRAQNEASGPHNELEQLFFEAVEETRRKLLQQSTRPASVVRSSQHANVLKQQHPAESKPFLLKDKLRAAQKVEIMEKFFANNRLLQALYELVFKIQGSSRDESQFSLLRPQPATSSKESELLLDSEGKSRNSNTQSKYPMSTRTLGTFADRNSTPRQVPMPLGRRSPFPSSTKSGVLCTPKYWIKGGKLTLYKQAQSLLKLHQ